MKGHPTRSLYGKRKPSSVLKAISALNPLILLCILVVLAQILAHQKSLSQEQAGLELFLPNEDPPKAVSTPQDVDPPKDVSAPKEKTERKYELNGKAIGGDGVEGHDGGAWTAETHLSVYGFNADWGLLEVLEDACRQIENEHNEPDSQWYQSDRSDQPNHPLNGLWIAPKVVDAKVIEIGCGVGVYVDALVKEQSKKKRKVFGIEPNPMGGTFNRNGGPKQLAVNFLENGDTTAFAKKIRDENIGGEYFDLIYSIEVFEHMPLDRHEDAARFVAGLARSGTKLIFGAGSPGQSGTGHIGNRRKASWEQIWKKVGFIQDVDQTAKATRQIQEYNHKVNTLVYIFQGP